MFRQTIYTLFVTCAMIGAISANAGFMTPTPRLACSSSSTAGCANTQACVLSAPVEANRVNIDVTKSNDFVIYQANPWTVSNNNSNTYTIQVFINGVGYTLRTIDESTALQTVGSFNFAVPPLSENITSSLDFTNPIKAYYQMVFDARNGGGDVYYSCADVFITNKQVNSTTTTGGATSNSTTTASTTGATANSTTTATTGATSNSTTTGKPTTTTGKPTTTATTTATTGASTTDGVDQSSQSNQSSSASNVLFNAQIVLSMIFASLYLLF